jgi:hypothetical protein
MTDPDVLAARRSYRRTRELKEGMASALIDLLEPGEDAVELGNQFNLSESIVKAALRTRARKDLEAARERDALDQADRVISVSSPSLWPTVVEIAQTLGIDTDRARSLMNRVANRRGVWDEWVAVRPSKEE